MKKGDIFLIFICIVLGCTLFLLRPKQNADKVQIYVENELAAVLPLSKDTTYVLPHQTVRIENGKVFMEKSTCPGQDCVRAGAISKKGETLVCLPYKVILQCTGKGDYDALTGRIFSAHRNFYLF